MDKKKITIIYVKANWCGYCKNFSKIYDIAMNNYKSNKFFKNYSIESDVYDFADKEQQYIFNENHKEISNKIEGYPTVYIKLNTNVNNNNVLYSNIEPAFINPEVKENQEIEAANRFLETIINCLKTLESDNSVLYTMQGGVNLSNNEIYKKKYLKYKSKYLELKKLNVLI